MCFMFDLVRRQIFPKHNVKWRKIQVDVSMFAKGNTDTALIPSCTSNHPHYSREV